MTSPFDYVNSVTTNKEYIDDIDGYIPYLINRSLSFNVETLLYANEMNINSSIDKRLQYDYYFNIIPKKKYYNKWIKKRDNADLELVRKYFNCSITKAKTTLTILSREQLETIRKKFEQGG